MKVLCFLSHDVYARRDGTERFYEAIMVQADSSADLVRCFQERCVYLDLHNPTLLRYLPEHGRPTWTTKFSN
jgi:hypothetical protein